MSLSKSRMGSLKDQIEEVGPVVEKPEKLDRKEAGKKKKVVVDLDE